MDRDAVNDRVSRAVADMVARQRRVGIDVVSDGELGKLGFINYLEQRYSGFTQGAGVAERAMTDLMQAPELAARRSSMPA